MADTASTRHPVNQPTHHVVPITSHPTPTVKRTAVVAARSGGAVQPPHPAVYAPWGPLLAKAETRLKTEITDAVRQLEQATAEAGQLLDTAAATAAEAGAALEAAGWAAWEKYTAAADDTRNAILDRARQAYDESVTRARAQYDKAMNNALNTYRSIQADATMAQNAAKTASA